MLDPLKLPAEPLLPFSLQVSLLSSWAAIALLQLVHCVGPSRGGPSAVACC
jgi:hypothetical protein